MAIADVAEYAHLSDADLKVLGVALDAIRRDIEDSRGEKDRAYIRGAIAFLPSNRYAQIAHRVRAVCATYDLPYTTGPLARQYLVTLRTISKLALPDRFLTATSDDAPETAPEDRFRNVAKRSHFLGAADDSGTRRGSGTAIPDQQHRRQRVDQRT